MNKSISIKNNSITLKTKYTNKQYQKSKGVKT